MQNVNLMARFLILSWLILMSTKSFSVIHEDKKVSSVQVSGDTNCVYFKLDGVTIADADVNNSEWFTVSANNESKKEVLSLITAAFVANIDVRVSTSGSEACGFAEVSYVRLLK